MGADPPVSVILPTRNGLPYLKASLRSVLDQTYRALEVLVVDDGSTDGTAEFVSALPAPVRYLSQERAGVAAARNRGLAAARGALVAFQDSDDLWHLRKLALQVEVLRDMPDVGLVCTAKRVVDGAGRVVGRQWKRLHSGRVTAPLFRSCFVTTPSVLVRRGVVEQVGCFDTTLTLAEDYAYWLRTSLVTRFAALAEPLVDVRRWPGSLTKRHRRSGPLLELEALERFYERQGGRCAVPPRTARRRLAQASFHAARACRAAGDGDRATALLDRSVRYWPTPRALWARLWTRRTGRAVAGRVR